MCQNYKVVMLKKRNNTNGFALIELIVVILIIVVLASISIPLMKEIRPNYRLKGAAKDILSNLQNAKLEAIKNNARVVVEFTTGVYLESGGVGGYQVFIDDGDGGGTAEDGIWNGTEQILSSATMPATISLITSGITFTGKKAGFHGQGLPTNAGSVQIRNKTRWYLITVAVSGRIKLEISSDGINWSL